MLSYAISSGKNLVCSEIKLLLSQRMDPPLERRVLGDVLSLFSLLLSSLELSDTQVYQPEIRALLGIAPHFSEVVVRDPPAQRAQQYPPPFTTKNDTFARP